MSYVVWRRPFWLLLVAIAGCSRGPELAPVSGHVMLDGKPLEAAEVTFQPDEGTSSYGRTDASGYYELHYRRDTLGGLVGSHTVRIRSATELTGANGKSVVRPQLVPAEFNTESTLRRDVESGENNEFDFDIPSKKTPKK